MFDSRHLANLRQKWVNTYKWDLTHEHHLLSSFMAHFNFTRVIFLYVFFPKKVRKIRMVAMWGQGSTNCGILQFRSFIRIGEHGVSLENIENIENMENMENM